MKKGLIIILLFLCADIAQATIGMQELSDSLMNYTGFSRIWSPTVRVRKMRVDGNHIVIHTNATLSGVRWTEEKATEIGATLTDKTKEYNLTVSDAVLAPWREGSSAATECLRR